MAVLDDFSVNLGCLYVNAVTKVGVDLRVREFNVVIKMIQLNALDVVMWIRLLIDLCQCGQNVTVEGGNQTMIL